MKAIVEERIPAKKGSGTEPSLIKEYKRRKSAIKRAKKESRNSENEIDIRVFDDEYELLEHMIYKNGMCVHSIGQ